MGDARGANFLVGAAHFYGTYECADGKHVAVGAIEPHVYRKLLELCGIDDPDFRHQWDREQWPALRRKLEAVLRARDEWCRTRIVFIGRKLDMTAIESLLGS